MSLNPRAFADTLVVAPAGRLDHESCDAFRADLQPHLERALAARQGIVFDLSGLDYISSGGLRCFMLASNEARARGGKIIVASPRPVVAVPAELTDGNTAVIGYDGSLQAARTLAAYVSTGLAANYENVVVTINEDYEEAARVAESAVEYLALHGVAVKARPVETRLDPAAVLLDHAGQFKVGLVVMGAFGHSALREFFFGSTTRGVLRGSKVPVMLYH